LRRPCPGAATQHLGQNGIAWAGARPRPGQRLHLAGAGGLATDA